MIEDPLSEKLLWKEFRTGETILVDVGRRHRRRARVQRDRGLRATDRRARGLGPGAD